MSEGGNQGSGEGAELGVDGITERVAAILAADAVGYSRLMADDEKATIAALDRSRAVFTEQIEANRGRVVDTAGDSVLAVFETTSGAVRASMAIQEGLHALNADTSTERQMQFRIGIHLGDIMEKPSDGTIYGDGVNVAARLEALSEPGGIIVSDSVHASLRGRIEVGFDFLGSHEGKNLKEPVNAYRLLPEGEEPEKTTGKPRIPLTGVIAAAMAAIMVVAGVVWWQVRAPEPTQMIMADGTPTDDLVLAMPQGPAIAVLPFGNLGQGDSERIFAEGLGAEIATALSRFDLRVTAQASTTQIGEEVGDRAAIAAALNVRYLLTGGVASSQDRLRVQVQLFDAGRDTLMWGETYERDLIVSHVFDVQDDITQSVVAAIAGDLGEINKLLLSEARQELPGSTDAYACVLMLHDYNRVIGEEASKAARICLESAISDDPNYADAWAALAELYADTAVFSWEPYDEYMQLAEDAARKAILLDPDSQRAHWALAFVSHLTNRPEQFAEEIEIALRLNPFNPNLIGNIGAYIAWAGDWERGARLLEKAFALDPNHPAWQNFPYIMWHVQSGRLDEALELARITETLLPDWYWSPANSAAILGHLGRQAEAAEAIARLNALNPDFAEGVEEEIRFYVKDEEFAVLLIDGLRKAGLFDEPEPPSRPVIAVLPFDNLSGDPEQDYFADGISEDILNQISPAMGIQVISRASSFRYRGSDIDASKAGEELGAHFLVLGSVRRTENAIRVTAELVEVENGEKIWSSAYDRTLSAAELFQIQDDISQSIVAAIADEYGVISQLTRERSRHDTTSLSSYECVLRAYHYFEYFTEANHLVARDCLEDAVQRDQQYAEAWGWLAILYSNEHLWQFNLREDPLGRSLRAADMAVSADRHSQMAWEGKAAAHFFRGERDEFHRAAQKAISMNPNDVSTIGNIGWYYSNLGEYEQALPLMDNALSLSPFPPTWYYQPYWQKHYADEDFEAALKYAIKAQIPFWYSDMMLASTHAQLGNEGQAASNLQKMLESNPDAVSAFYPMATGLHWPVEFTEKVAQGLEKAGLKIPNANEIAD